MGMTSCMHQQTNLYKLFPNMFCVGRDVHVIPNKFLQILSHVGVTGEGPIGGGGTQTNSYKLFLETWGMTGGGP
jgi:hypothetical protein